MDCSDITMIPKAQRKSEEQEELRLYYVAASRARKQLINARNL